MFTDVISSSEARKNFPSIIKKVDQTGTPYIVTINGEKMAAIVDIDLFEQFVENTEFGISEGEIIKRSEEETISLENFKSSLNV